MQTIESEECISETKVYWVVGLLVFIVMRNEGIVVVLYVDEGVVMGLVSMYMYCIIIMVSLYIPFTFLLGYETDGPYTLPLLPLV